jgi:hypothetical protein
MPAVKVWYEPTSEWVMVGGTGPTGPAGPAGPPGAPGSAGATYHHVQSTPDTTWTVDHMLGRNPNISVLDSAGSEVEVSVLHTSLNQAVLSLSYAVSGTADCS